MPVTSVGFSSVARPAQATSSPQAYAPAPAAPGGAADRGVGHGVTRLKS